jgi:N6-L-threonylcarbamoyladenine synthase
LIKSQRCSDSNIPAVPIIERIALEGDPKKIKFTRAKISDGRPDFSFSGLKTAVAKHRRENNIAPAQAGEDPSPELKDLAASFQASVIDALAGTTEKQATLLE